MLPDIVGVHLQYFCASLLFAIFIATVLFDTDLVPTLLGIGPLLRFRTALSPLFDPRAPWHTRVRTLLRRTLCASVAKQGTGKGGAGASSSTRKCPRLLQLRHKDELAMSLGGVAAFLLALAFISALVVVVSYLTSDPEDAAEDACSTGQSSSENSERKVRKNECCTESAANCVQQLL